VVFSLLQILQPHRKLFHRHRAFVSEIAAFYRGRAVVNFFVAENEEVRNFLHLAVPDLFAERFGFVVKFNAHAGGFQNVAHFFAVFPVGIGDRKNPDLHGCEPDSFNRL